MRYGMPHTEKRARARRANLPKGYPRCPRGRHAWEAARNWATAPGSVDADRPRRATPRRGRSHTGSRSPRFDVVQAVARLAPRAHDLSRSAARRGRPPRHGPGGDPLQRAHGRAVCRARRGHPGGGRVHALQVPLRPVDWCREALGNGSARALVVNSGNANAFTGRLGREAVAKTATIAAQAAGCAENEVYIASTGVIGEPLPAERFEGVLADCAGRAQDGAAAWAEAAKAIMTTDTSPSSRPARRRSAASGCASTASPRAPG